MGRVGLNLPQHFEIDGGVRLEESIEGFSFGEVVASAFPETSGSRGGD